MMTSGCCCCKLAISLVNSNGILDDDFSLTLNGNAMGTISGAAGFCGTGAEPNAFCTGRIWCVDTTVATYVGIPCFGAGGLLLEPTLLLDTAWLVNGVNNLRVLSTVDRHCGNFGTIQVVCLKEAVSPPGTWEIERTIATFNYTMTPLTSQDFFFTYP